MVIQFKSLVRPRRAAKALCEHIRALKLSEAQEVVAHMCGYDDWAQLKQATEAPGAQASPDDEDLPADALKTRRDFQAQQVRAAFNNTLVQAREIVRRTTPTARSPVHEPADHKEAPPLRGANVYMPSLLARFAPRYPQLYGYLLGVRRVRLDFIQPSEHDPGSAHVASSVSFDFANGQPLTLQGVYFWKFLDAIPRELQDDEGRYRSDNPYTPEPLEELMYRLRTAYQLMFSKGTMDQLLEKPPLWVELDLVAGTTTTRRPPGLQRATAAAFDEHFGRCLAAAEEQLQQQLDEFIVSSLAGPRVELKFMQKSGRGASAFFGNEYVRSSWAGTGHWTPEDLMMELSPTPWHPGGQGGNRTYRDLLSAQLQPYLRGVLLKACAAVLADESLTLAMAEQLELAPSTKTRRRIGPDAEQLVDALWPTYHRLQLAFHLQQRLLERQESRTLSTWVPKLSANPDCVRPSVRMEALLAEHRPSPTPRNPK